MNLFAIEGNKNEINFVASARSLDNLRVVKMVLETAQLASTGLHQNGIKTSYKPFNPKHPTCLWVSESSCNYTCLLDHFYSLLKEYSLRFGKQHKCINIYYECYALFYKALSKFPTNIMTPFRMAMPKEFQDQTDVVGSYRKYFLTKPNIIYPENKIPEWFLKGRNIPFKLKQENGKIIYAKLS